MDQQIEAVFLDLGGVVLDLRSVERARALFIDRLAERHEVAVEDPEATFKRVLGEYFRERETRAFRPARDGYQRAVEAILAEPVPTEAWWPLFVETAAAALEPRPGATATIRALDEAGYYLGLVSDIDAWEADFILQTFEVRDCFDDLTTSEEVGRTKPAPAMFETALEKAGVDPGQVLYVGDRYENDMEGGSRAGFHTVAVGEAAEGLGDPRPDGTVDDPAVDYVVRDLGGLRSIVGIEDP